MILEGRYYPDVHVGSREQIIRAMFRELAEICDSGLLRLHAKRKLWDHFEKQFLRLGVELYRGIEHDYGYLLGRDMLNPHDLRCTRSRCVCEFAFRQKFGGG